MVHTLKAIAGVELGSEDPLRTTRVSYAVIPVDGSKGLKTATAGSMASTYRSTPAAFHRPLDMAGMRTNNNMSID